jgi:formate/nitrite transporter FocA (FNT family)
MAIGATAIIIAVLIAAVWIIIEAKRLKHKIFAIILIALIILTYISFTTVIENKNMDLKTPSGIVSATKLYFSWIGNALTNIKSVTTFALKQNWSKVNDSAIEKTIFDKK